MASHPDFIAVGNKPDADPKTILDAWAAVRRQPQSFVAEITPSRLHQPGLAPNFRERTIGLILQDLAQHSLHHLREIEALLGTLTK
jgi:hypothetical protein